MKRTFLQLILAAVAVFAVTACGHKIHVNDVSFRGDTVYYQNKPFSGEIWTDDDKSGFFLTEQGVLKSLTFYHDNGKKAIIMTVNENGSPHTEIYDEQGTRIDFITFQRKYSALWIKIAQVQGQLLSK